MGRGLTQQSWLNFENDLQPNLEPGYFEIIYVVIALIISEVFGFRGGKESDGKRR